MTSGRASGHASYIHVSGFGGGATATHGGGRSGASQRSSTGGGQRQQQQQRSRDVPTPQQLREWYTQRQRGGGFGLCTYILRTGDRAGEQYGGAHPAQRCFGRLTDAWRQQFPEATEIPRWGELSRAGVAIFDLDFDVILAAMYAVTISDEGDCYQCFPPNPGIGTAALGASEATALGASASVLSSPGESALSGTSESALSGTASASTSHTFTLDSGASRSFFRDRTTLTPLSRPVAVSLTDPSGGPVVSRFSTVLPCPAAPSGTLSGLYLPSFSTNLRVTHRTEASTDRHQATFTRQPGSSLYTVTTASPPVPASGREPASGQMFAAVSRSGPESAPCSCRRLSHETLLWHHRLGHPSLLRLRGMASRLLVSGLPRSLPPLPQGPGPSCVPSVEGRQRAAPHSSQFPPTEAPLQTLHMDVWGPARVRGLGHERYFLLVVDDYSRYTTVFPLRSKGDVTKVLIVWIRAARLQLRRSFGSDFPILRLHSDRGGEFSSGLLRAYCRARGIRQTFTLPDSPQQNGIAERRIGMVMDVARTSMMHAAAPHFLWPFAVRYAAHQINLHPRVSRPETSLALLGTGKVGDASAFRVWGFRAFVRDLSADKLSPRLLPASSSGSPLTPLGGSSTTPPLAVFCPPRTSRSTRRYSTTASSPTALRPSPRPRSSWYQVPPPVDPLPPQGPAPSGVSHVDAVEPVEVTGDSGAAAGAETGGVETGGAEPRGAETGGAEPKGAEPGGAEPGGAEPGGAEPGGVDTGGATPGGALPGGADPGGSSPGGSPGASSHREPLSPQELREWFDRRWRRAAGAGGSSAAEGAAVAGPGGARTGSTGATRPARSTGAGAAEGVGAETTTGGPAGAAPGAAGGSRAAGGAAGAGTPAGGTASVPALSDVAARPRPYFVPLLQQVLGLPPSSGPPPPLEGPQPIPSQSQLQPASPLPSPSPYAGPTGGLTERREPASRPASPVRTARTSGRSSRQRPPPVPGTHRMSLRPSTASLRAPLPSPPESSLPALADPESDSLRAASPTVTRFLATVVIDPSFESFAASALVTELVDFAARCRLDYAASLVVESEAVCPPSVGGECALGTDVLEDRKEEFQCLAAASPHLLSVLLTPEGDPDALDIPTQRSYAEAIEDPYSSQWQAAMDTEMASWKSTGTYVDAVPPPGANIVSGMWIFRVKRPPGSPPVFKARYVAHGFCQRQGVDYFQTFSPTPKMTTLQVLLHVAAHRDYELHSLDFSTAFLQGSLHEEIWLRRPPGFTGSFPPGTQWSLRRPSLFLRTDTSLPPFYILVYVDDLVFATAGLAYVKSELQKRHTYTDLGELRSYLGLQITRDRARRTITMTQSHMVQQVLQRFGFTYSSPQATPLPTRHSLSAQPSDESVESIGPYPELVGRLMYLMTCTRPDLAYPLSILARYVAPGRHRPEHMAAAKRVLRYLCSTSGMGLVLGGRSPVVLTGHADASWADDQATQRSSQGYTFSLVFSPHSSEFPPTEVPLQTLHMDVWGPARVRGQGHERYFLLVVDNYSRYTTVFPLRRKGEVTEVLIDRIRAARRQLSESFGSDLPILRLHSDRGGEFSSDLLRAFCRAGGIRQTLTLAASPLQNGIAERHIGMIMDVAQMSIIHAAAPHFLWPFAVQYAAHQLNLQPRVSMPKTTPTLRWTGKVGNASALRFYHPTLRRVVSSKDVTFDELVPYYRLFPYRTARPPPPPLLLAPGPPPVHPLPPQSPAPSGVSQVDAVEPVEVDVDSGAARGGEPAGAESGGADSSGAEPWGVGSGGAQPGVAESGGAEPAGAELARVEPGGAEPRGHSGASSRREPLSPQQLREWFARRWSHAAGASGATCAGGPAAAGAAGGSGATGPGGARTGGTGAAGLGGAAGAGASGGAGAGGAAGAGAAGGAGGVATGAAGVSGGSTGAGAAGGAGAGGAAGAGAPGGAGVGAAVLGLPPSAGPAPSLECPPPLQSQSQLHPASPLPAPSPYIGPTGGLTERREPESRPTSHVRAARTSRRGPRQRPSPVPVMHPMALHPSTAPQRVPLLSSPASSLPDLADPETNSLRAASPTVTRLLATVVTDPSFESTFASALVAELVDFAAHCRLDYAASLVAESESA
ncbi:unnamed protein product [Closterium sp. NIES-54]